MNSGCYHYPQFQVVLNHIEIKKKKKITGFGLDSDINPQTYGHVMLDKEARNTE